jgi:polypeptide N-acetylgalactosaminyltransferase
LHEIILVDDASDKKHLQGKLTRYIQRKFPSKVKLLRLNGRHGLIRSFLHFKSKDSSGINWVFDLRARLAGARLAKGDVLLFLDSHCECGQDWLRPMLQVNQWKSTKIACFLHGK